MIKDQKKVGFLRRYRSTILFSFFSTFLVSYIAPYWIAVKKLNSLKMGEYPEMPKDQIQKQYDEQFLSVIIDSIVMFLVISILAYIPVLFIRFKISHNINIFSEFMQYRRSKKQ